MTSSLLAQLFQALGPQGIVLDPEELAASGPFHDLAGGHESVLPLALLRPESVEDVVSALTLCQVLSGELCLRRGRGLSSVQP